MMIYRVAESMRSRMMNDSMRSGNTIDMTLAVMDTMKCTMSSICIGLSDESKE